MMKKNASLFWTMLMVIGLGTGNLIAQEVSRTFEIEPFTMIDSDIVGNVIFTQSEEEFSVEAEGDEELVENLRVEVKDQQLILRDAKKTGRKLIGRFRANKLTVKISSPELVRIQSDGAGGITLEGEVVVDRLEIESDGVGNIEALDLHCGELRVDSDGVGSVKLGGSGTKAILSSSGVGGIDAQHYQAKDVIVELLGMGGIKCYASGEIELYGKGVGGITYYGDPDIKVLDKSGVGKIVAGK